MRQPATSTTPSTVWPAAKAVASVPAAVVATTTESFQEVGAATVAPPPPERPLPPVRPLRYASDTSSAPLPRSDDPEPAAAGRARELQLEGAGRGRPLDQRPARRAARLAARAQEGDQRIGGIRQLGEKRGRRVDHVRVRQAELAPRAHETAVPSDLNPEDAIPEHLEREQRDGSAGADRLVEQHLRGVVVRLGVHPSQLRGRFRGSSKTGDRPNVEAWASRPQR